MDNYFYEGGILNTPGIEFVKDDAIRDWQIFVKENKYMFSGIFIKTLITFMQLLYVGATIEEIKDLVKEFDFNNTLLNGICVALLKFSSRGKEFFDEFYILDVPESSSKLSLDIEKQVARSLRNVKFISLN